MKKSLKTVAVLAIAVITIIFVGCSNINEDKGPFFDVIIDLDNVITDGDANTIGSYTVSAENVITVSAANAGANAIVLLRGNITGYSIKIDAARNVYIDNNTTITGADNVPALILNAADVTLRGRGAGITITGGGGAGSLGGIGIGTEGNLTITGTIGTVQGGNTDGAGGIGIGVAGNLIIAGRTGDIKSGIRYQGSNDAIYALGDITISGTTGDIAAAYDPN